MENRLLIGGRWTESKKAIEVRSPYTRELITEVFTADPSLSADSVSRAVEAAIQMRGLARFQIAKGLRSIAAGIENRREEFARLISLESAKPLIYARGEVDRAIATFGWAAGEAERFTGEIIPIDIQAGGRGKTGYTIRQPKGVIYGITPFNFPLNLVAHKVAPALAAGNAIIIKPSPRTPLTALLLGAVFLECGLPASALQVVPLDVLDLPAVFADDRVSMISFTGSADVGWRIKQAAGKKSVTLELGGNAPVIVDRSTDLSAVIPKLTVGAFSYSGQVCISVQRLYLHRDLFDAATSALIKDAEELKKGDPLTETTRLSVMIDEAAAQRSMAWVDEAIDHGARVLCGGRREGAMMDATILTGTDPEMRVVSEEVFAPVLVAEKFENIAEAIAAANHSKYGLQAGVFSNDAKIIDRAIDKLNFGGVIVNDVPTFRVDNMPYGGIKDSGLGREGVLYAMEEMSEIKLVVRS